MDGENTLNLLPEFIFQTLIGNNSDYIYIVNLLDNDYYLSDNMIEDFAIDKKGKDFYDKWSSFIHKKDLSILDNYIENGVTNKRDKMECTYQVTTNQGMEIWLKETTFINYNSKQEPVLIIGILHSLSGEGIIDNVTGLLMHEKLEEHFDLLKQNGVDLTGTVMLIGIDNFKLINTLNDHNFGDLVLRITVQELMNLLPEDVLIYRFDGDQLILFSSKCSITDFVDLYEKINKYTNTPHNLDNLSYRFTLSSGIASFPNDGDTWAELEKAVSTALEYSKRNGKNQCTIFKNEMLIKRMIEQSLKNDLANSVNHDFEGFNVVYQPICFAQNLKIKGAEALLRYEIPGKEVVSPTTFIPVLEENGLISKVGLWVLEKAIQTCKLWVAFLPNFVMNVNVSYLQLYDSNFCENVKSLLDKYELDSKHLTLELTESYFITEASKVNEVLEDLKNLHLQVAMDDFGTGYSSLASLARFNVDVVKIDRSFIKSLNKSKYNYDFVDSVIRLCHNAGMKVCIEGVETRGEQEYICLLNSDFIQGFYVAQPIVEAEFYEKYILQPMANDKLVVTPDTKLFHEQLIKDKDILLAMIDSIPLSLIFWNRDSRIMACNIRVLDMFNVDSYQEFSANYFELSPKYQDDGKLSIDKMGEYVTRAFDGEPVQVYWKHLDKCKREFPVEIRFVRIPYMNDYVVLSYTRDMSEQSKMEESIKKFSSRLKAILDASPLCLNLWNQNFENTMCNKEAVKLFDLDNEETYTKHFFELSPPIQPDGSDTNEKSIRKIKEAFETGYSNFFWMHQNMSGKKIPAEINLVRIDGLGDNGEPLVAGFTRDMSKQIELEEKNAKFNLRLKAILDATPLCINLWNTKFENTMCNKEAVKLFDLNSEKEYIDNFFNLSPKYQKNGRLSDEMAVEKIAEAFEYGFSRFEWHHCKLNGEIIESEITLVRMEAIDDESGILVAGFTRDIRTQVAVERIQQQTSERIRAVLDSMPLACILWTIDLKLIDCNKVIIELLGADSKQDVLDNFESFMPMKQPDGEYSLIKKDKMFEEVLRKGVNNFEWVYNSKNGDKIPAEVTLVKLKLETEDIIVAYSRDLREFNKTLELNQRLSNIAYKDVLTGCSTRIRFMEKLDNYFLHLTNESLALSIFDIDYFKTINDNYGHTAGDLMLQTVASTIESILPSEVMLGRYGGDEFLILHINKTENQIQEILNKCVKAIKDIKLEYNGKIITTSISVGTTYKRDTDKSSLELFDRADKVLYEAKQSGRCCSKIL
ncbi:EAL domain-containing protein [Anaerorhabdus sp.]|uniref:EAL domain-containing protein n=1 Tax=Anaerorhabdus sp. TaxID=1872524 RepID=UPI002FC5E30F